MEHNHPLQEGGGSQQKGIRKKLTIEVFVYISLIILYDARKSFF